MRKRKKECFQTAFSRATIKTFRDSEYQKCFHIYVVIVTLLGVYIVVYYIVDFVLCVICVNVCENQQLWCYSYSYRYIIVDFSFRE